MIRLSKIFAAFFALLFTVSSAGAQDVSHNLSGNWRFSVVTENGTGTPVVVIKQEGSKITGSYESRMMGARSIEGSMKGDSISFELEPSSPEGAVLVFRGVVVDSRNLKGIVDYGAMGGGATFTGTRLAPMP